MWDHRAEEAWSWATGIFRGLVPIYLQQQVGPLTSNQGGKQSPGVNQKFHLFQAERV